MEHMREVLRENLIIYSMATIPFTITTPEKALYKGDAVSITVPTENGEITVLPEHIPLVTVVASGDVIVHTSGGVEPFTVVSGLLVVDKNKVTLLADFAEHVDTRSDEHIKAAEARAKEIQEHLLHNEGDAALLGELEKSLVRIKSHAKWKTRRKAL
jgi:F-type H+-transporting ATPase subunit epsilon